MVSLLNDHKGSVVRRTEEERTRVLEPTELNAPTAATPTATPEHVSEKNHHCGDCRASSDERLLLVCGATLNVSLKSTKLGFKIFT
jgi:hypothetical protein